MHLIKRTFIVLSAAIMMSCLAAQPSPWLMGTVTEENSEVVRMVKDCSEGINFVPTKPGCDVKALKAQSEKVMEIAEQLIKADYVQPQGYDIFLHTVMVYFLVADEDQDDYDMAVQVSRQFLEVQKAEGGKVLDKARFWLVYYSTAEVGLQNRLGILERTSERRAELIFVTAEGEAALLSSDLSRQWVRVLESNVRLLEMVINSME